jgi:hypothetical protein
VVDFSELYSKLKVGNKIIVDFGAVCMSVIGFEDEAHFLSRRSKDDVSIVAVLNLSFIVERQSACPLDFLKLPRVKTQA